MVKYIKYVIIALCIAGKATGQDVQNLTLEQAYVLSEKNYPVTRQSRLIDQTAAISIDNLNKGYLPQLSLSGQATYQSEVTEVPIKIPGFDIESPSKDQYKLLADVNQVVFDGGTIKEQKVLSQLNANVEQQKVAVEIYKLKERINQLYLGVLYLDEQLKQIGLVEADLQTGIKRVEAQVNNGVAFRSNLNVLKAEQLKTDQRAIELKATRKGLIETLALFLGQPVSENTTFTWPANIRYAPGAIARPELKLYDQQTILTDQQNNLIRAKNLPKASLFVQGGYGRPGLNMLKNEFDLYYVGGVRVNWSLGGLYTKKKEKEQVEVNKRIIDIQKETFLLNTNTQLKQTQSEIEKLQQLVATDDAIIDLRQQVKEAARAQLENGVITANDYLREVNAEDQARQARITHKLQMIQAEINYQTISGKL
jgi:outer membrane protein TolC